MSVLDLRTVFLTGVIINAICTLVAVLLWRSSRDRFDGTGLWAADFAAQTAAFFLIGLRGVLPDVVSISIGNALSVLGALVGLLGLGRFWGKPVFTGVQWGIFAVYLALHNYYTYFEPSLAARNLLFSASLLALCGQCAWLLLYRVSSAVRSMSLIAGIAMTGLTVVSAVRIVIEVFVPIQTQDYMHSGTANAMYIVLYLALIVFLAYALALMVNRRLLADLGSQEQKFSKAFHSSPDAVILTRLADGSIYEVNDTFTRMTGFTAAEVIGKTTVDLGLWADANDREIFIGRLREHGSVFGLEFTFRIKSGELLVGQLFSDVLVINEVPTIVASISDITERKRAEERLIVAMQESDMLRERAERLGAEKEIILREVHHRIKNNLSTVHGLLSLQANRLSDPQAAKSLRDAVGRVRSMGLLYDKLYRAESIGRMSMKTFLERLVAEIAELYPAPVPVAVSADIEEATLDAKILSPLGIMMNELVTNAMKYAFTGRASGRLDVRSRIEDRGITIIVEDNGIGLPDGIDIDRSTGFGMQLVGLLAKQIGATIRVERGEGTRFVIEFTAQSPERTV
ncbi:MAG TPA: histidine kinase dimerization/phosphoacceptor domain -containing protein [Spirochaetota bacterium]|nr:histidine kinase dimerization/phosphoacceptor domain -containing protein [Spirochaetota bacterium]HOS40518.1 histidine kinase dimerization/phosphoacceptor domain -containing protein [Spirochaetota bacterium]HPI22433.1 histidine kinase dimerization/phosphoacceptor domain -containing protein [Spirochaetota bacterium]HPU89330.1 histidine kinase dimerization/phosphoacceptor domain -containing protein [Spirochaetota bacterium]